MRLNLFGRSITMEKTRETPDIVKQAQELLEKYRTLMTPYQERWIANEEWYKLRHWELIRNTKFEGEAEPTTAMLFSAIIQKHADAMDFYPKPNILPREMDDLGEAKRLSEIIPVELEWNDYLDVWSDGWYDKLKLGAFIQGVFFDKNGANGIGANTIKHIDALRLYCDPTVKKIKDSKGVFIVELIERDDFVQAYPDADPHRAGKLFEPKFYNTDANKKDTADMILVIDYYYMKRNSTNELVVHLLKFAGDEKLYWSEEDPDNAEGFYQVDQYPIEIDVLYQEKDNVFGFGMIDVIKNPQTYIDKLDSIILGNTFKHSRKRFFVSDEAGISLEDYTDPSKEFVRVEGLIRADMLKEIDVKPTDSGVYVHRQNKIQELKDVSSTNEFSRGESGGGVTAAQAIALLQKASGKTSRSMIQSAYSSFSKIVYIYIELMRQFYDLPRTFRIDDPQEPEGFRFENYTNENLQPQPVGISSMDEEGQPTQRYRKPIFDIKVTAEKQDPFSQEAHNERIIAMFQQGMFAPQRAPEAEIALEQMNIEGKDQMIEKVKQNNQLYMLAQQIPMLQEENMKLKMIVQKTTGKDLGVQMPQEGVTA
jgi:hypothetical protein